MHVTLLLTILQELHDDLCERNLSHNPNLKPSDGIHDRPKISDSNGSETSTKSLLLLALLQRWGSLRGVTVSSENPATVESEAYVVGVPMGKEKGVNRLG